MKHVISLGLLSLALAGAAFGAPAPLLTKVSGSGFVPADYVRGERCDVYADKVVITRQFGAGEGGTTATETRAVTLSDGLAKAIERAAAETVKSTDNGLCDGPETTVQAGQTVLFTTGGCGSPRQERQGSASQLLRDLVDSFCPKTYDTGRPH